MSRKTSLLDHEIRQVLVKHKVHLSTAYKERLYIPRKEMGRGLHSIKLKSECMLLQRCGTIQKYIYKKSSDPGDGKTKWYAFIFNSKLFKGKILTRTNEQDNSCECAVNSGIKKKTLHEKLFRSHW